MAYLIGIPLLALLAIFQSTILSNFGFLDGRPDLVLLAVVGWGLAGRTTESMVWGLIGGIFLDLLSGLPFGSMGIILVLVAYLVSLSEGRFWEMHLLLPLGVMLLASIMFHILGVAAHYFVGRTVEIGFSISRVILPSTFLNLVLALPATQLAKSLRLRLYPPEVQV